MNDQARRIRKAIHRLRPYFNTATDLGKELDYLFVTAGQYADRLDDLDDPINDPMTTQYMGVVFVDPGCQAVLMTLSELNDHRYHGLEVLDLYRDENGVYTYEVQEFSG